jgi:hypothetical protein
VLFAVAFVGMVILFSVTTLTFWLEANPHGPSSPPDPMKHFGSIHSGRYANYAMFIAQYDRVPYLAQNMGASILASCLLILGADSPLATLTVWIPFSLAALACVVFGVLRQHCIGVGMSLIGTYFVLFCNIALSLVHVMVLDNGSPLGFAGYTDIIISAGTFLIFTVWVESALNAKTHSLSVAVVPFVFGAIWCWVAPQNIVVAGSAGLGTILLWLVCQPTGRWPALRWLAAGTSAFILSIVLGVTQIGAFLPKSLQEVISAPVFLVGPELRIRPYILYIGTHWTERRLSRAECFEPGLDIYLKDYHEGKPLGHVAVASRWVATMETDFWVSLRLYGFPLIGLLLMGRELYLRSDVQPETELNRWPAWFWLAFFSLLIGYVIAFFFELRQGKWWLTRFLVPAVIVCLVGLVLILARPVNGRKSRIRQVAWISCVVLGTIGPAIEFVRTFQKNWIDAERMDPFAHRLNVLMQTTGPFLLESNR